MCALVFFKVNELSMSSCPGFLLPRRAHFSFKWEVALEEFGLSACV